MTDESELEDAGRMRLPVGETVVQVLSDLRVTTRHPSGPRSTLTSDFEMQVKHGGKRWLLRLCNDEDCRDLVRRLHELVVQHGSLIGRWVAIVNRGTQFDVSVTDEEPNEEPIDWPWGTWRMTDGDRRIRVLSEMRNAGLEWHYCEMLEDEFSDGLDRHRLQIERYGRQPEWVITDNASERNLITALEKTASESGGLTGKTLRVVRHPRLWDVTLQPE